jgi:two-component system OmpR family sensor kinase
VSLPIRARLALWFVVVLAAILAGVGAFLVVRLRADLISGVDQNLDARAAQISLGLKNGCEGEFQDISDSSLVGLPLRESGAQLLASDGSLLESTGDPVANRSLLSKPTLDLVVAGDRVRRTIRLGSDGESFRVLAVALPDRGCDAVVVVGTSLEQVDGSVGRLVVLLAIGGPVALAAAGLGGWWLSRRALEPVSRMTREAAAIDAGRLDERIEVPVAADELRGLATTLNTMLERVQAGVDAKRRFVADASHELRTPLAVMRSEIEVALRSAQSSADAAQVLRSAREEVERMTGIVENLFTLARMDEEGIVLARESIELSDVAEAAADDVRPLADAKDDTIAIDGNGILARADPERLRQVVTNLLGNAIRHSPRGAIVEVSCWDTQREVGLTVRDSGSGIPAPMLTRVFDRFVREDGARSSGSGGGGLGLAICKQIIEAHDGRIWAESREGGGSSFSFTLPRSEDGEGAQFGAASLVRGHSSLWN